MNDLEDIILLLDSDYWFGDEIYGRFFPLFSKPNLNRIFKNDISQIRDFLISSYLNENLENVDRIISKLNGISYGFTSLLFYLKNSNKYNVFLPITVKGINNIFPDQSKPVRYRRPFKQNYERFNDLCNDIKTIYSVEPQELDVILTVFGKKEASEILDVTEEVIVAPEEPISITNHTEAEAILIKLGNLLGYETYTADPSKIFQEKKLGEITTLEEIPDILKGTKNIHRIDVIWYNEASPPNYFFEVEDKGTMRDALHRLYQTRHLNARFFIVGPKENLNKFEEWVSTAPYNSSRDLYNYRAFDELSKLYIQINDTEKRKMQFGII